MEGLGDLFGSIGEMLGGIAESDEAAEGVVAGLAFGRNGEAPDASSSVDRYLCGGPRTLNVNDL